MTCYNCYVYGGICMKVSKEINTKDLDNVSGGSSELEEYLKALKEKEDKPLVDYGTGTETKTDPTVPFDDNNNTYIIKREKEKP